MDEHKSAAALTSSFFGKSAWAGAGGGAVGYLSTTEWLTLGGFIVAVISAGVSMYYARKDDARKERFLQAQLDGKIKG
jgi:hypothetical protein